MSKKQVFLAICLGLISLPSIAKAEQPKFAYRGTQTIGTLTYSFLYIFDTDHGILIEFPLNQGTNARFGYGEYTLKGQKLTVTWDKNSSQESGWLQIMSNGNLRYSITRHTGDARQIGAVVQLKKQVLSPQISNQLSQFGRIARKSIDQKKMNETRYLRQLINLQQEINTLPYKYSNAFGKALGQVVID